MSEDQDTSTAEAAAIQAAHRRRAREQYACGIIAGLLCRGPGELAVCVSPDLVSLNFYIDWGSSGSAFRLTVTEVGEPC